MSFWSADDMPDKVTKPKQYSAIGQRFDEFKMPLYKLNKGIENNEPTSMDLCLSTKKTWN